MAGPRDGIGIALPVRADARGSHRADCRIGCQARTHISSRASRYWMGVTLTDVFRWKQFLGSGKCVEWVMCARLSVGKGFHEDDARPGRCGHVFGLLMRHV